MSSFFCLCRSLSHHLFVLSIFNEVFSFFNRLLFCTLTMYRACSSPTWIEYPLLYTAVLYLRQPVPLSIISNHPMSTIKLVLLIGSLTVIRACGFSTFERSFNPSTSSTYAVSLRTRELIVLAISCLFFSSYLPAVIYKWSIFSIPFGVSRPPYICAVEGILHCFMKSTYPPQLLRCTSLN